MGKLDILNKLRSCCSYSSCILEIPEIWLFFYILLFENNYFTVVVVGFVVVVVVDDGKVVVASLVEIVELLFADVVEVKFIVDVELFVLSVDGVVSTVVAIDEVIDVKVLVEVEGSVVGSSAAVVSFLAVVLISVGSGGSVSAIVAGFVT
jgi:hypothetical protein